MLPRCPLYYSTKIYLSRYDTMAMSHEIKVGVRAILQALPKTIKKVFIVFTIPEDRVDKEGGWAMVADMPIELRRIRGMFKCE
ncbi:hypothetical protein B9Z19DRAFT_1080496 [Tuber borchii]|uniref:Uncharacterized protein n=1 Tax=Tuber borchii TaxID=42251 RepID=A0A2T6ZWU0_TUBBO|nr:hypothetical protein B9Z19DRAFT_1080496 [Tuber borchii]